jgi:hypothetical protein
MLRIISKGLLALLVFVNIFSQTRLYVVLNELYIGKFVAVMLLSAFLFSMVAVQRKALIAPAVKQISWAFAIWFFFMLTSLFNGQYPVSGALVLFSYAILFFLAFILVPNGINSKTDYLQYNKVFLGSVLIALMLSIIMGVKDPASFYIVGERIRYQAFFRNPNYLGMFSLLGILSSFQVYAVSQRRKYLVVIIPLLFLLYLSNSRASMMATGVAALVVAYLFLRARSECGTKILLGGTVFSMLGGLLVLGNMAVYCAPPEVLNRVTSLRLLIWSRAVGSLANIEWFFGQGIGRAGVGSLSFDNYYVNTLVQTGFLGLSALIVFIMSVFYWFWSQVKWVPNDIVLRVTIASFVALVAYSLFESALFSIGNILSIYVWMNIGYQLSKNRRAMNVVHEATTIKAGAK